LLDQLLFRKLVPHDHPQGGTPEHKLPWLIITAVTKLSFHKFFNKIIMVWAKSEYCSPQVVKTIRSHAGEENNEEMWTLLASVSNYLPLKSTSFVLDYFEENCQTNSEVGTYTLQQVLKVLSNCIKDIPSSRAESLQERLLKPIKKIAVSAQLISPMMDVVTLLSYKMTDSEEEGQKAIEEWVEPILTSCDDYLKSVLFDASSEKLDNEGEESLF
ncbi:hypothetical protein SK128_023589, partial [Halocaridina rubra]